jgi:hypothetical protein
MLDIARPFRIIRIIALELEFSISFLSLLDHRLNELLLRGPPNTVATTAMVENNRRLVRLDDSLLIFKGPMLIEEIELEVVPPYLLRKARLTC